MKRIEVAQPLKTAWNLYDVKAGHCKYTLAIIAEIQRGMPGDSHGASSRYDPYLMLNAPLHLSSFMRDTQRAGTFLVSQIRKLQDGRPTVKNDDRWNEAIAFTLWSWQRRGLGTGNRLSVFGRNF